MHKISVDPLYVVIESKEKTSVHHYYDFINEYNDRILVFRYYINNCNARSWQSKEKVFIEENNLKYCDEFYKKLFDWKFTNNFCYPLTNGSMWGYHLVNAHHKYHFICSYKNFKEQNEWLLDNFGLNVEKYYIVSPDGYNLKVSFSDEKAASNYRMRFC